MRSSHSGVPVFVGLASHPLRWRLLTELAGGDYRVRELAELVGEPQNLVSYHLRLLREGGLVVARRSSFDARDSYHHLDLERCAEALAAVGPALHPAVGQGAAASPATPTRSLGSSRPPRVLFACTGNSARSPIAAALMRRHAGDHLEVTSAGSHPRTQLHPNAVRVLRDGYGIDIAGQRPRHLDGAGPGTFDAVVTLCDRVREVRHDLRDHARLIHWSIPDPADAADHDRASYPAFRQVAADIDTRVRYLLPVLTTPPMPEIHP